MSQGVPCRVTQAAAGDGGGGYYLPEAKQTQLRGERWRGEIAALETDPAEPNMLSVKFIIPADVGGFTLREAALYDEQGDMLAVCNLPDTQKAAYTSGSAGKLTIIMHILVTDAGALDFTLEPRLDGVSRDELTDAIAEHDSSGSAHSDIRRLAEQALTEAQENALAIDPPQGMQKGRIHLKIIGEGKAWIASWPAQPQQEPQPQPGVLLTEEGGAEQGRVELEGGQIAQLIVRPETNG